MKKLKFLKDHVEQWAQYNAGDEPEQWFANEVAARLAEEGIAEITDTDAYTKLLEATAKAAPHDEHDGEE